jgi:SPP1 gp7 family putative phage head morphogenesis protein
MPVATLKPVSPQEAIDFFRDKGANLEPTFSWTEKWQEDHATAFTVAKSAGFDILGDIHAALDQALSEGRTFEQFAGELKPLLVAKGWWGKKEMTDPHTGETRPVQLGSSRRLRTIFDVNTRMAYAAGRWQQIQRTKAALPYLRYVAVMDTRTRPLHRLWNGTVLPVDHPWWDTHYPPCGWRCRCSIQQLSARQVKGQGIAISEPPDDGTTSWANPVTGETIDVPKGIDPGFGYNVGIAAIDERAAMVYADKLIDLPPAAAATAFQGNRAPILRALTRGFARWYSQSAAAGDKDVQAIGVIGSDVQAWLKLQQGVTPISAAIAIDRRKFNRMMEKSGRVPAQAVAIADLLRLPDQLGNPRAVLFERTTGNLVYVFDPTSETDRTGKIVVEIDFQRGRSTVNMAKSAGLVPATSLRDQAQFTPVVGEV